MEMSYFDGENKVVIDTIKSVKQLVDQRTQDCYSAGLNGYNVKFIENTIDNFGTYKAMDSSTVVIAQNSCAAFEALGWGHRVLFCQPNKCRYRTPDDLYYSVTEHNQEKFNKKLDELFIIFGSLIAAELIETLSAPAFNKF